MHLATCTRTYACTPVALFQRPLWLHGVRNSQLRVRFAMHRQVGQEEVHTLPPSLQPPPPVEAGTQADQAVDLNAPPEASMPA